MPVTTAKHLQGLGFLPPDLSSMKDAQSQSPADKSENKLQQKAEPKQQKQQKQQQQNSKKDAPKKEEPKKEEAPKKDLPPAPTYPEAKVETELLYMKSHAHTEVFELQDSKVAEVFVQKSGEPHPVLLSDSVNVDFLAGAPSYIVSLVLDKSVFHPQGGGQPTDLGYVSTGSDKLDLVMIKHCKASGRVLHDSKEVSFDEMKKAVSLFKPNTVVSCHVDGKERMLNARIHSAGHLLDVAVKNVCGTSWRPAKGYHFADGPYVEYLITEDDKKLINADKEGLAKKIEEAVNALVDREDNGDQIKMHHVAGVRHIDFCGVDTHCGGTHVDRLSKIGHLTIGKIQPKKDKARVAYRLKVMN